MRSALLIAAWATRCAAFTSGGARAVARPCVPQKTSITTCATRRRGVIAKVSPQPKDALQEANPTSLALSPNTRTAEDDAAANLALVALITAFTAIQWARAAIYYCVDFSSTDPFVYMNAGLGFGVEGYGALATVAFAVPFTLVSLGAGALVDQSPHRGKLVALATAGVGVSLVAQAAVPTALGLGATRALQGAFSAAVAPAAYSLLAELFEAKDFANANSKFTAGIYVGGAVASLSTLLDEQVGWRTLSLVIGAFAFVAAGVAAAAIPEPRIAKAAAVEAAAAAEAEAGSSAAGTPAAGTPADAPGPASLAAVLAPLRDVLQLLAQTPALQLLFAGSMLRFCAGFTILAWLPPFMHEAFPLDIDRFSVANAAIKSGGGFAATVVGASLCASLGSVKALGLKADAFVPAAGSLLAAGVWALLLLPLTVAPATGVVGSPASAAAATAATAGAGLLDAPFLDVSLLATPGSFEFCMGALLAAYLVAENWLGPTVAIVQRQVPPASRGAALGLFGAATQVVGNAAPAVVGALSAGPGGMPLRDAFLAVVGGSYVISSVLFAALTASLEPTDPAADPPTTGAAKATEN